MAVNRSVTGREAGATIEECDATVEGHRMRYLRAGSGPALVLIHGLLGYSFSWRLNIPVLARHFSVYAPDLLGIGYSDRPRQLDCGMRTTAERMLEFCRAVRLESFDLVGTSHGGGVAAMMALMAVQRRAPRIRRLVLVAPVNPWSVHGRRRTRLFGSTAGAFLFRALAPFVWPTHGYFLNRLYADPRRIPPGTLEGYGAPLRMPRTADFLLAVMRCWKADLRELGNVYRKLAGFPTLLMWGDRDPAVSPASAAALQQAMAGSELVMFRGVGHLPYEEAPEEFNRALLRYLQQSGSPAPVAASE